MSELSRATPLGVLSDHIGGAADSLRAQAERYRRAGAVASAVVGASNLSIRRAIETINAPAPLPKFGPVYNPGDIVPPGGGNDTRDTRDQQGGGNQRGGGNRGGGTGRADGLPDLMAADPSTTYTVFTPPTAITDQISLDKLREVSQRFHTEMARLTDPRTAIADWAQITLGEFKRLLPSVQAQLKDMHQQFLEATDGAKLFQEFVTGSAAASAGLGESMTKWAAEEAAANAERAKMQREWILGIQKQIELSADASELTKFQWDREHGLGEAARLTNEEYEERAEALSKLQDHNAELEKSRRFEEALANMVRIRAEDEEKAAEAAEAQRQRFLDRLGDMGERLRSLSGLSGEAELKARLLGEGLTETQTEALAAIDLVISRMEAQRAEMERIANAGADAL